jgi:hypothetical protein
MHMLYLGAMNWIVKQVLVGPGMLMKRPTSNEDPQDIFNHCLDHMWMPRNFQRLPPKVCASLNDFGDADCFLKKAWTNTYLYQGRPMETCCPYHIYPTFSSTPRW